MSAPMTRKELRWAMHRQPKDQIADHEFSIWCDGSPVVLANVMPGEEGVLATIVSALNGVAQSQMTELEAAQAIAAVANECCYRSDGWEEAIADTALKTIRSLRPPNPAQSGEYDKLLTSWAECRKLLSDERKKNDGLIAEIERLRAGVAQTAPSAVVVEALDNSQSLLVMVFHLAETNDGGIPALDWANEDLSKLVTKQIAENRGALSNQGASK